MSVKEGIALAILAAVLFFVLRESKSPIAVYVPIFGGVLLISGALLRLAKVDIIPFFEGYGVQKDIIATVLKVLSVGFLTEIGAQTCEDLGASSLSRRLTFFGNTEIFLLIWPTLRELLTLSMEMLS